MCDIDYLSISEVNDPITLSRYIQQRTGSPAPTFKELMIFRKTVKAFFVKYPHLGYPTLCRVADWGARNRRRYATVGHCVNDWKYAYAKGALPEIDDQKNKDPKTDKAIGEVLAMEQDPTWRMRFMGTQDRKIRRELLKTWTQTRQPQLTQLTM